METTPCFAFQPALTTRATQCTPKLNVSPIVAPSSPSPFPRVVVILETWCSLRTCTCTRLVTGRTPKTLMCLTKSTRLLRDEQAPLTRWLSAMAKRTPTWLKDVLARRTSPSRHCNRLLCIRIKPTSKTERRRTGKHRAQREKGTRRRSLRVLLESKMASMLHHQILTYRPTSSFSYKTRPTFFEYMEEFSRLRKCDRFAIFLALPFG